MLLSVLLLLLLQNPAPRSTPQQLAEATDHWMRDYVRWIATEEERQTYGRLSTVEQRLTFIESFWARRDPTPGTLENEARETHQQRFAYAAKHFGAGRPGYLTDRGRIYILLGPPHSRVTNPEGRSGGERPSEIWTYNSLPSRKLDASLDLNFVDFSGTGDYRLVSNLDLAAIVNPLDRAPASSELAALAQQRALQGSIDPATGRASRLDPTRLIEEQFDLMRDLRAIQQLPLEQLPPLRQLAQVRTKLAFAGRLPLLVRPEFFLGADQTTAMVVTGGLNYSALEARDYEQLSILSLDLFAQLLNPAGAGVASAEDRLTLKLDAQEYARRRQRELLFQLRLTAPPGPYRFELIARDNIGGELGNYQQEIELPAFQAGDRLTLSSLSLADSIDRATEPPEPGEPFRWGELRVVPNLTSRFRSGRALQVYFHVYGLELDPQLGTNRLEVRLAVERAGELAAAPPPLYPAPTGETRRAIAAAVPTARLGPGDYLLRATVADQIAGRRATGCAPFTLLAD